MFQLGLHLLGVVELVGFLQPLHCIHRLDAIEWIGLVSILLISAKPTQGRRPAASLLFLCKLLVEIAYPTIQWIFRSNCSYQVSFATFLTIFYTENAHLGNHDHLFFHMILPRNHVWLLQLVNKHRIKDAVGGSKIYHNLEIQTQTQRFFAFHAATPRWAWIASLAFAKWAEEEGKKVRSSVGPDPTRVSETYTGI